MGLARAGLLVLWLGLTVSMPRAQGWGYYGGDQAGTRYSTAVEITRDNLDRLRPAWTYRTGDDARRDVCDEAVTA